MDTCLARFNSTVLELLSDLKSVYPQLTEAISSFSEKYEIDGENSKSYFDYFAKNVYPHSELIAEKDISLFEKTKVLDELEIGFIFTDAESEGNREVVWQYLDALYIYTHKYLELANEIAHTLENPELIIDQLKTMGFDESYFNEQSKVLTQIMENMQAKVDEAKANGEEFNPETAKPQLPPDMEKMADSLFGGMIGNLAKEIATEIDPSTLNIDPENPQALLQSLLSGENTNLMSLVQNITGKIQHKMESGQIDQQALFGEAASIMNNLQNIPGMPANMGAGLDPNMMMNMMTSMMMGGQKKDTSKNLNLLPKNHPKRRGAGK